MHRIRGTLALTSVLLVASVSPVLSRVAPNPGGRLITDPDRSTAVAGRSAAASRAVAPGATHATTIGVALPVGAEPVDSTWYDLQDMGSLGPRIVVATDGSVHVTWQDDFCELDAAGCPPNFNAPQPHPMRGMGYARRAPTGAWTNFGKVADPDIRNCCLTELFGGFGTIALDPQGRAAISQHMNEEGCDLRGNFYLQDSPTATTWKAFLTPIVSPSYLFPQVAALPNGSYLVLGEVPRGGEYDETNEFRVSRIASAALNFTCPVGWQGSAWSAVASAALFPDGRPAFPSLAVSANGRAGIAVTDFGNNVWLFESSDGTFAAGTITTRNLTSYSPTAITAPDSTSTQWRPFIHAHLAYNDTTPNVVWSELQARKIGGVVQYFDWRSRIRHWSSTAGLTTVRQVQPGEADHYDEVDRGLDGPLAGFNTISIDWPQVGFSSDGFETYVAWLRFVDGEVDPTADMGLPGIVTGIGFGDIAVSVRGSTPGWSPAQNLTNTPNADERFFSLAPRNEGGEVRVLFQASATNQAGVSLIGDRGTAPGNLLRRIAYLEKRANGSVLGAGPIAAATGAQLLRTWPNPARDRVSFAIDPDAADAVEIFDLRGRRVARVALVRGEAQWQVRDKDGRPLEAGLYFARPVGVATSSTRLLLMR